MKYLILLTILFSFNALANPEVSNDGPIHFVLDRYDADNEHKTDSGQCKVSVRTNGDGTADGFVECKAKFDKLPWHDIPGFAGKMKVGLTIPDTPCQLYGANNNAGNNQGHNVTQYNSYQWIAVYEAEREDDLLLPYEVKFMQKCLNGVQQ